MDDRYKIKLGFLPTRRNNGLSKEIALKQKNDIYDYITKNFEGLEVVKIDEINDLGILHVPMEADKVIEIFQKNNVDAIFAPHCNFGCEDGVAKVAKVIGKPFLLWGERDEMPDAEGIRSRDSQCGMFATSKSLLRYGVKFSYITNSKLESETFKTGFEDFLAVASIVKNFKYARIGQIGVRPTPFASVMTNESELVNKFGIEVVPVSIADITKDAFAAIEENSEEYQKELKNLKENYTYLSRSKDGLEKSAGLIIAVKKFVKKWDIDVVAMQCWASLQTTMDIFPCVANGILCEEGIPMSCETDVNGAITMLMLNAASRGKISFLSDVTIRHPEDDNVELLWHCGNFPKSMALKDDENAITDKGTHPRGLAGDWQIKGGDVTIARFDGIANNYSLLIGEAQGIEGSKNKGTYLWTKFDNWPKWEHKFIYGPYIHHVAIIHGKYARRLYAATKYIDYLEADPVYPDKQMLEDSLIY